MSCEAVPQAVRAALAASSLWREDAVLLAAVSGGADSVALLASLCRCREEIGFQLSVCYIQHGLRGESSQKEEQAVRTLCAQLDVPLAVRNAELNATMETPGIEALARQRRRQLFAEVMKELSADALLTAHHLDDQAETVLMRLLRGAGMKGLAGMEPSVSFGSGLLLRPFLGLRKSMLCRYLDDLALPHCEDESNQLCCTARNILRLTLLPQMEQCYPEAVKHIAQAADILREDDRFLDTLARDLYRQILFHEPSLFGLRLKPLLNAHRALRLRVLRRFYQEGLALMNLDPDERSLSFEDSYRLDEQLFSAPGEIRNLPNGLCALRGLDCLHLIRQGGAPLLLSPSASPQPMKPIADDYALCGMVVKTAFLQTPTLPPTDTRTAYVPEKLRARCVWRTPKPDDCLHPLGSSGMKPLRRWLTDRKIDLPFRCCLPVLALDSDILWIPGLVTAEALRFRSAVPCWRLEAVGEILYQPDHSKE
ncbi:MAG: tRNA lysidine(34) synthetase TilS [Eubacteriales bacterium]|nr:tRNA lysidine(34) synthetase TilS [Eubacteriales bacterium]